jgi:hypothetical protein
VHQNVVGEAFFVGHDKAVSPRFKICSDYPLEAALDYLDDLARALLGLFDEDDVSVIRPVQILVRDEEVGAAVLPDQKRKAPSVALKSTFQNGAAVIFLFIVFFIYLYYLQITSLS